jgi:hypothetical protein
MRQGFLRMRMRSPRDSPSHCRWKVIGWRVRLLYRDADGLPEEHDKIVDVVMVHSGEGTLMLGGTMSGKKGSAATGEYLGTALTGGEVHPLAGGGIVHIPAGIPHSLFVPPGKHITYVLLKFPAKGQ